MGFSPRGEHSSGVESCFSCERSWVHSHEMTMFSVLICNNKKGRQPEVSAKPLIQQ